jgi:ABC-type amino acid transport substrate-binding protein
MSSMTITDARLYRIAFCNPYMISGQVSLVRLTDMNRYRNGFTDLLNPSVKIGTVKGTTGNLFIEKNVATDRKQRFYNFETPQQGVKALLTQKIDAFVYDLPMNFYFAAQNEANGLAPVTTPMTREQIAWGVRKDDTELQQTANAYLASIKQDGLLKKMLIRWIPFFKNVFNR